MPTNPVYYKSCCYTGITYYTTSSITYINGGYVSISGHTLIIPGVYQTNTSPTAGVTAINIGLFGTGDSTDTVASACTNTALTCASSAACININSTNTYSGYSSTYYVAGSYGGHP